jgi:integrase
MDVTVRVLDRKRRFFYMRAELPDGSRQERSTGVATGGVKQRREAERVAAVWEAELKEGRYKSPSKVTWDEFTEQYDREVLSGLADRTGQKVWGMFGSVTDILKPRRLADVTTQRISHFQTVMRERGRAEDTIASNLAHLKSSLRWAGEMGMLHNVPKIVMPKRAKGAKSMKGRPLAGEEFERMQTVVPLVVGDPATESWDHLLRGLWWSGLRLEESLNLTWDLPDTIRIDVTGRFVMLRIGADNEKGHRDRLYPVSPEFADMILAVPESDRTGSFFKPLGKRGGVLKYHSVCKIICSVGERANIVVDSDGGKTKYASAQDLRRSFGLRWSERVMPAQLKELMRHESISTTMSYYVGRNAEATAAALYEAVGRRPNSKPAGDTSGDTTTISEPVK